MLTTLSNFAFLKAEWPELHDAATKAEGLVYPDARQRVSTPGVR